VATIKLRAVSKSFGDERSAPDNNPAAAFAIEQLDLTILDGQFMAIVGPSGCGKSTLLRLIAGLIEPDSGEILYDGQDMIDIPPNKRRIGMVFQDYALYPQHNVRMNIMAYFMFRKKTATLGHEAEKKYRRTSRLMGVELEHLLGRMPRHLSGGERQRVAIARCITRDPNLFLMDEPFANLDQKLRENYRVQLKRLLREFPVTTVYVTHDQREALALANTVAIMNGGRIEQVGPPRYLYDHPKNLFVAEFLNFDQETPPLNLLPGEVVDPSLAGKLVGIRPENITVCQGTGHPVEAKLLTIRRHPVDHQWITTALVAGHEWGLRLPADHPARIGRVISVCFHHYHVFNPTNGHRLS
jgi:multiple sugar transport system ATP-binding protein